MIGRREGGETREVTNMGEMGCMVVMEGSELGQTHLRISNKLGLILQNKSIILFLSDVGESLVPLGVKINNVFPGESN